jgi:hypothetical protein
VKDHAFGLDTHSFAAALLIRFNKGFLAFGGYAKPTSHTLYGILIACDRDKR